jgi:hypothetical protein
VADEAAELFSWYAIARVTAAEITVIGRRLDSTVCR